MRSDVKNFFKILGGLLLILGVAVVVVPFFLNPNSYKATITDQVQKSIGREVKIDGDIKLRFLPTPKIKIKDVKVASLPGAKEPSFANIGSFEVSLQLWPLLRGHIDIDHIKLERARIVLEQMPDNRVNWEFSIASSQPSAASKQPESKDGTPGIKFDIRNVTVSDSSIAYITPQVKHEINKINLEIDLESLKGPYLFKGDMAYLDDEFKAEGRVEKIADVIPLNLALSAFEQRINLEGQAITSKQSFEGELKIKGHIKDLLKLSPDLKVPDNLVNNYKIKSQITASPAMINAQNLELVFGNVNIVGNGSVDLKTLQTALKLTITPGNASFNLTTRQDAKYLVSASAKITAQDLDVLLHALKIQSASIPKELKKNLTISADLGYNKGEVDLKNIFVTQGKLQLEGNCSLKERKKIPFYTYEFKTSNLLPLAKLFIPTFSYDLGAFAIKGESSGRFEDMTTNTHIMTALAHVAAQGTLQLKDNGKSTSVAYNLSLSADGSNLKATLARLGISLGDLALGKFNIATQMKGDSAHVVAPKFVGEVAMGKSLLTWKGSVEGSYSLVRPKISATLAFGTINIDNLLAQAPKTYRDLLQQGNLYLIAKQQGARESVPLPKHSSRWSHEKIDLSFLKTFDGDFKLSAPRVQSGSFTFDNVQTTAKIVNGILEIPNLSAKTFGGTLSVKFRASSQQGQPINLKLSIDNANLRDIVPKKGQYEIVKGKLNLQADLNSSGSSQFQYIKNLSGSKNTLQVTNGTINGFDLQKLTNQLAQVNNLGSVLKLLNMAFEKGQTDFSRFDAVFAVSDGVARITRMEMVAQGATASATGKINLPAYSLNIDAIIKLTELPKYPPIGLHVFGALDAPQHEIDAQELQQYLIETVFPNLIKDVMKNKKNPKELLKGILGGPDAANQGKNQKEKQPSQQEKTNPVDDIKKNPEKAIGNILKGLF